MGSLIKLLWNVSDGKKMWTGIIATFLLMSMQLASPVDAGMAEQFSILLTLLKDKFGVDPLLTTTESLIIVGAGYKIYKFFTGKKSGG